MKDIILILLLPVILLAQSTPQQDLDRWKQEAARVTIIRDTWGIPHVYGTSDADAVFGLMYAQCEDDFSRVEMNYIEKLGRIAEVKGESALAGDLYDRLVIDADDAKADYSNSPDWLKKLMNAYADGINYYLSTHPSVHPMLLNHFEAWYPLLWTDGSIGAISTGDIRPREVGSLYLGENETMGALEPDPLETFEPLTGSNGFALAPSKTASGNAILYINPHVTFYFRPEVHVVSEEGLDAYGAVTWGQFFVYQGFNQHCGWMHTSSNTDVSDMYIEKISKNNGHLYYEYNSAEKPVTEKTMTLRYKSGDSTLTKTVTAYYTGHGPIMAKRDGQWLSVRSYNRALKSLIQSWERTKSTGFESFKKTMELRANTSNNTVFADDKGNIAYWHGDFMPKRDPKLDWSKPVDGTTPATEWNDLHPLDEIVHVYNPPIGWIQNCNSTPFTVSGNGSPKRENFPAYMAPDGENFRGINAARILSNGKDFTIDTITKTAYDRTLTAFEILMPALIKKFESDVKPGDSLCTILSEPIAILKQWDDKCDVNSVATTLAVTWGSRILRPIFQTKVENGEDDQVGKTKQFAATASANDLVAPLYDAVRELEKDFGTWKVAWGDINRYQRVTDDLDEQFYDDKPSLPVGFASSTWGMLAAFNSRKSPGTKKFYGVSGASFICAVEFGKKVKAKSLLTGGESGDPASKHFFDQGKMYSTGQFKEVYFYIDDVKNHMEERYHPGEKRPSGM